MSEEDFPRRRDDLAITEVATMLKDHIERYDRDRKEDRSRYEADWKHTQEWRQAHWGIIDANSKILAEIAPNYRRGMWVIGAIILGTIGCVVKAIFAHFSWK